MIPQCNPKAGYLALKTSIDSAIQNTLSRGQYILGSEVKNFESEFAKEMVSPHAVGVGSGTDALELALRASNIGAGDWVATVSHTAVATASAIRRAGAEPLFVDINPRTYTMDPGSLELLLNQSSVPTPKAIIPVHLYGQPADMSAIMQIAEQYKLTVIEDCAQAHGAKIQGLPVGTWGEFGCFSFYPTKNLSALGDGGMVIGEDSESMDRIRYLREYGWEDRYVSSHTGINSRLDELQAAVLRAKLPHLAANNRRRADIANQYHKALSSIISVTPSIPSNTTHVYHQYVVQVDNRADFQSALEKKGVRTAIHYPKAIHQQPAFSDPAHSPLPLTHTEAVIPRILSLPMFPELNNNNIDDVIAAILHETGN